jgi:S-adenosylmethionine:tRNA ribosyltransferase-isomerase
MKVSDFDYHLPPELIAQTPLEPRDRSRLMVLSRADSSISHRHFFEIADYLQQGDTLVFNDSRVIPARLSGTKIGSTTRVELLLLRRLDHCIWETLVRPGKKITVGTEIKLTDSLSKTNNKEVLAEVIERGENGIRVVRFSDDSILEELGQVPLPPYIHKPLSQPERYQTVYARIKGSVAAPTAGLHFTPRLLKELQKKGIQFAFVTLHIGLDTFQPVRVEDASQHPIHTEYGEVSPETTTLLNQARKTGKRIIAVGTSTVRLVEAAAQSGTVQPLADQVNLFILPGYQFRITDAMITNFHLPRSTLLMLVSAFSGRDFILKAYEQAMSLGYRFYSFGDAMLIL